MPQDTDTCPAGHATGHRHLQPCQPPLNPPTHLKIHAYLPTTKALGPNNRAALWVQGCPLRCPGCIAPATLPFDGGQSVPIATLAEAILTGPDIEGITLSGGEPFAQPAALAVLIDLIRHRRDFGVIVYSGYTLKRLQTLAAQGYPAAALLARTDLLIDGPYVAAKDDGLSLRGSDNQGIHSLTDRYRDCIDRYYGRPGRPVEFHVVSDGVIMAGIPGQAARRLWVRRFADDDTQTGEDSTP